MQALMYSFNMFKSNTLVFWKVSVLIKTVYLYSYMYMSTSQLPNANNKKLVKKK